MRKKESYASGSERAAHIGIILLLSKELDFDLIMAISHDMRLAQPVSHLSGKTS